MPLRSGAANARMNIPVDPSGASPSSQPGASASITRSRIPAASDSQPSGAPAGGTKSNSATTAWGITSESSESSPSPASQNPCGVVAGGKEEGEREGEWEEEGEKEEGARGWEWEWEWEGEEA